MLFSLILLYTFSCATYNISGIAVTGALSAVHRVMLEALRTLIVWAFGLWVHYCVDRTSLMGEVWTTLGKRRQDDRMIPEVMAG
eukprot:s2372_g14.t1